MKRKSFARFSCLLAFILVLMLAAGCGKKDGKNKKEPASQSGEEVSEQDAETEDAGTENAGTEEAEPEGKRRGAFMRTRSISLPRN